MVTIGILLKSLKQHVIVANSHDEENDKCAGAITIPRGCIKNYSVLMTVDSEHTPKKKKQRKEIKTDVVKQSDNVGPGTPETAAPSKGD